MRKTRFPFKEGDYIEIFTDYQTCEVSEGKGKLIGFISEGLPFILQEIGKSAKQIVYSYQTWLVEFGNFRTKRKIRYIKGFGDYSSLDGEPLTTMYKDVFLSVNGKQVF